MMIDRTDTATDQLEHSFGEMLTSLARLFETRALLAQRSRGDPHQAYGRRTAYEDAAREVTRLAARFN